MANEVAEAEGRTVVTFSGPRKERVDLDRAGWDAEALFPRLNDAARWFLENPRETEIRHTLLSHEIAREWPPAARSLGAGIGQALSEALEAAQLAYRAHLLEKSRDGLKAMSDLRKALGDETSRIADRARALITGLWRDAAVAAAALTIRIVEDFANPDSETWVVRLILIVVAVIILLSYAITIYLNHEFLTSAREVRSSWRDKIYTLVGKEEYDSLVDGPIRKDEGTYRRTIRIVGVIYLLLIGLLLVLAFPELGVAELLRDLLAVPAAPPATGGGSP
jgi:hypothetical protein